MQEQEQASIFDDKISPGLQQAIFAISRWSKILSVTGFAIGAFVVVFILFSGRSIINFAQGLVGMDAQGLYGAIVLAFFVVFFIVAAVLYFLYKGATLLQQGAEQNDTTLIAEGFKFLKWFFTVSAIIGALGLIGNIMSLFK